MIRGTAWLSCATAVFLSHTLGWESRHIKQIIFGIYVAYYSQPETSKVLIYDLARIGLQYALIGLVTFQAFHCLVALASTTKWTGQGEVLLMPCKTTHSRLFNPKHPTGCSNLLVGIPVGWEGVSGGLVSSSAKRPPWPFFSKTCFCNIDSADHLGHGETDMGLRGKLDAFLKSQGAEPAAYPHAYLVTTASFLGYHVDPVSFWYLYSEDMSLAAVVLEINDAFGERRTHFLKPTAAEETNQIEGADARRNTDSRRSNMLVFTQENSEDSHVSSGSREALYSLLTFDPLKVWSEGREPMDSTITLTSSNGRRVIIGRLVFDGQPMNPSAMTDTQKIQFLLSWWWVDLATLSSAILEAASRWFYIKQHVWSRPAPLGIGPGHNTACAERTLEVSFRMYLRSLVEQCQVPVALEYVPSGTPDLSKESMLSPSAEEKQDSGVEEMEFRVLTPAFYTRFVFYAHDLEALFSELRESCTIWVSRPELLPKLLFRKPKAVLNARGPMDYLYFEAIRYLRRRPERMTSRQPPKHSPGTITMDIRDFRISPMDALMLTQDDAKIRRRYRSLVLRLFVAERLASGSLLLVDATLIILQTWLAWNVGFKWEGKTRILALAALIWAYGHG